MKDWTDLQIEMYYKGTRYSDYPSVFWSRMLPFLDGCETITDIGCGPGAFALQALEEGFRVNAVDSNFKNLNALKNQVRHQGFDTRCLLIHGNWLEVPVQQADASICAYSLGGSISSPQGLNKILETTRIVSFFITPSEKEKTEFNTEELFKKLRLKPPAFTKNHDNCIDDILTTFRPRCTQIELEILEYDFGMPLINGNLLETALFLSEKLQINAIEAVKEHIKKFMTIRNGLEWLPNPRKSALITCLIQNF